MWVVGDRANKRTSELTAGVRKCSPLRRKGKKRKISRHADAVLVHKVQHIETRRNTHPRTVCEANVCAAGPSLGCGLGA